VKTEDELRNELAQRIRQAGGVNAWARSAQVPNSIASRCSTGVIQITPAVAKALGYEPVRMYRPTNAEPARTSPAEN